MRKLNRFFDRILYASTAVFSIAFFIIVIIAVSSRYIIKAPILASIELSRLFFVWSCFLAAAITYRRKAHVAITFVFNKFPPQLQKAVQLFNYSIILIFSGIVFYYSIFVTQLLWRSELPMLEISQSWFYVPVPLVFICILSYTIEFIINLLTSSENEA